MARTVQAGNLRDAAATVARRLAAGFVPQVHLGGTQRWVRMDRKRRELEESPITPPEGIVLDELVLLDTNEPQGVTHWHRIWGRLRQHRHRGGTQRHSHMVGNCSVSYSDGEIVHP